MVPKCDRVLQHPLNCEGLETGDAFLSDMVQATY
jgi:hypothetical protein